jgi:hypothetical protein
MAWTMGDGGRVTIEGLDRDGLHLHPCETAPEQGARLRDELHAYIQFYKNGLIRNDWYR